MFSGTHLLLYSGHQTMLSLILILNDVEVFLSGDGLHDKVVITD